MLTLLKQFPESLAISELSGGDWNFGGEKCKKGLTVCSQSIFMVSKLMFYRS